MGGYWHSWWLTLALPTTLLTAASSRSMTLKPPLWHTLCRSSWLTEAPAGVDNTNLTKNRSPTQHWPSSWDYRVPCHKAGWLPFDSRDSLASAIWPLDSLIKVPDYFQFSSLSIPLQYHTTVYHRAPSEPPSKASSLLFSRKDFADTREYYATSYDVQIFRYPPKPLVQSQ